MVMKRLQGTLLAYPSGKKVYVLDAASLHTAHVYSGFSVNATAVRFSPDGKWIATGECRECLPDVIDRCEENARLYFVTGDARGVVRIFHAIESKTLKYTHNVLGAEVRRASRRCSMCSHRWPISRGLPTASVSPLWATPSEGRQPLSMSNTVCANSRTSSALARCRIVGGRSDVPFASR